MPQSPDNKPIPLAELLKFFSSLVVRTEESAPSATGKAFRSFAPYCGEEESLTQAQFSAIVRNWLIRQQIEGVSLSTAVRYLKAISGLYTKAVKENLAPSVSIFKSLTAQLRESGDTIWSRNITADDFRRLITYTKRAFHNPEEISLATDMIIFSLINGGKPLQEIGKLQIHNDSQLSSESREIVERNRKGQMKYLFPLDQSKRTPKQLQTLLKSFLVKVFAKSGVTISDPTDDTLTSYWAYGALMAGCSPDAVLSYLGTAPAYMQILTLGQPMELSAEKRTEIAAETAAIFVDNPLRWYAMHLRRRITYEDLTERLRQIKPQTNIPELFYPCTEIAKRIGKKKVLENQPIIRDIVYFKTRVTAILPLFFKIGDIAWCYKNNGKEGTTYAAIPESSFKKFQETIGCFTPEYTEYFAALEPLKVRDEIIITGGLLSGYSGKLLKVKAVTPDGIVRYIVEICKDITIRKIIGEVDARQVRKKTSRDPHPDA